MFIMRFYHKVHLYPFRRSNSLRLVQTWERPAKTPMGGAWL